MNSWLSTIPIIAATVTLLAVLVRFLFPIVTGYPNLMVYLERPKLTVSHFFRSSDEKTKRYLGFVVDNTGKNVAREVSGEIIIDSIKMPIIWEGFVSGEKPGLDYMDFRRKILEDIRPGIMNIRCFFVYLFPERERTYITLNWDYHGQRSKIYKKNYYQKLPRFS